MRVLSAALMLAGVAAACSSPATEEATELPFSARMLEYATGATGSRAAPPADTPATTSSSDAGATPLAARTRADEWRRLLEQSPDVLADLEVAAADEIALSKRVLAPLSANELATLAVLRSPAVRTARARYEAARTAYAQSRDLGDLVGLYRSFTRDTATRVGPERSRRSTETVAPAPNVDALSAEIAQRTVDIAFESLRVAVRDTVARAWTAHADAARLHEARTIVREEVELDAVLLEVLRSRLEAGRGSQAGYLAFEARLERLRTELSILDRQETVVRAEWNRLLSRPEAASVEIGVPHELPATTPSRESEPAVVETALAEREELRSARLAAERAELGVRLAETMTLPRLDVGSSRFERERAGEAGVQRGGVFPAPGRMVMPRSEFGVREAQVQEMRSRHTSLRDARDAMRDKVRTDVRTALFRVDAAAQRVDVHERELVPLARNSLDAARGAYEGNRSGYLDLLDAVRRLLDARLGLADARRNLVRSQADLLRAVGVRVTDGS